MRFSFSLRQKSITISIFFGIFIFLVIVATNAVQAAFPDPYKTLGVDRHASLQEIRRAYKALAKEW